MKKSPQFIDPVSQNTLIRKDDKLISNDRTYDIIKDIPRFVQIQGNYVDNFSFQWKKFARTQIDNEATNESFERFFRETGWIPEELDGLNVLEAGSGAGRFSSVILKNTKANLFSFDYSTSVEVNWEINGNINPDRFVVFQASIYEIPFPPGSFDKVVCLGVLQHTPDFERAVHQLIKQARIGGEIVVDFYELRGPWTKVSAKYMLRPILKKWRNEELLAVISKNIDWMIWFSDIMHKIGLGAAARFLPIVDLRALPHTLTKCQRREWAILDTFDMFSPDYDNPQKIYDVAAMFKRNGAQVTFAGRVRGGAVVRAIRTS